MRLVQCSSLIKKHCYLLMFQGDISPVTEIETIWEICVVLLGACFTAGLVGAFGALLSQNDTLGLNSFKIKMKKLKQYMIYRCIPDHLQSSIFFFSSLPLARLSSTGRARNAEYIARTIAIRHIVCGQEASNQSCSRSQIIANDSSEAYCSFINIASLSATFHHL